MWLVVARQPVADAPHWPGRRCLAGVDAVVWPLLFVVLIMQSPLLTGMVIPVAAGVAALVAAHRLHRALWMNPRYRFTTWRWGKLVAALLVVGVTLKLTMFP